MKTEPGRDEGSKKAGERELNALGCPSRSIMGDQSDADVVVQITEWFLEEGVAADQSCTKSWEPMQS